MNKLLQLRNAMNARKPSFLRQDANKVKSLEKNWRSSSGIHSSMRRRFRGHPKSPSIGYGSPREVRGLSKEGYDVTVVHTLKDFNKVKDACVIASAVGIKKKLELVKRAREIKCKILNVKDSELFISQVEESLKKRKESTKSREEKKKQAQTESLQRAQEKETKEKKEKANEEAKEEKTKEEKEMKRKVLEQQ